MYNLEVLRQIIFVFALGKEFVTMGDSDTVTECEEESGEEASQGIRKRGCLIGNENISEVKPLQPTTDNGR